MAHSGKQPLLQAGQDIDSDLDKDDNSEIVLDAAIRDTSRIIPGQTRDKYYLTYFSFYLLGIVVITPWSFFVTANDVSIHLLHSTLTAFPNFPVQYSCELFLILLSCYEISYSSK